MTDTPKINKQRSDSISVWLDALPHAPDQYLKCNVLFGTGALDPTQQNCRKSRRLADKSPNIMTTPERNSACVAGKKTIGQLPADASTTTSINLRSRKALHPVGAQYLQYPRPWLTALTRRLHAQTKRPRDISVVDGGNERHPHPQVSSTRSCRSLRATRIPFGVATLRLRLLRRVRVEPAVQRKGMTDFQLPDVSVEMKPISQQGVPLQAQDLVRKWQQYSKSRHVIPKAITAVGTKRGRSGQRRFDG